MLGRNAVADQRAQGSAHEGAGHWQLQRLTAVANLLLVNWFMASVVWMEGADYAAWRAYLGHPVIATLMLLFVVSVVTHARLGLQVVAEDYVNSKMTKLATMGALVLASLALGAACVIAVLKVALGS